MGVNESLYDPELHNIVSNASCTTNCLAPIVKVLHDNFDIKSGLMTTTHSYTNDQKTLDSSHKKFHRGRAAALSLIPTTTGAASAIGHAFRGVAGKINGIAVRVPTPDVSLVDLVVDLSKDFSVEDINRSMKVASQGSLKKYLGYEEDDLVSVDFIGDSHSSIFASRHTMGIGSMAKVLAWYDNEWRYACRVVDLANFML